MDGPGTTSVGREIRGIPGPELVAIAVFTDKARATADKMAELGIYDGAREATRGRLPCSGLHSTGSRSIGLQAAERRLGQVSHGWSGAHFECATSDFGGSARVSGQ